MKYIINRLKTYLNIKFLIFMLVSIFIFNFCINYITRDKSKQIISIVDNDNTELSKRLYNKIINTGEYKKYEKGDSRVYTILKGFEEKLKSSKYKNIIRSKNINSFELEKINLRVVEVITEMEVISKINNEVEKYDFEKYDKDLKVTEANKLINLVDKSIDKKVDIVDEKTIYLLILVILFLFISNMIINVNIIDERDSLIIERLLVSGVSKFIYYIEKFIEILIINMIFISILLFVNFGLFNFELYLVLAILELFIYSILLQGLKLDRNSYIVIYLIMFIIFVVIYLLPNISISYMSPIELIGKIFKL